MTVNDLLETLNFYVQNGYGGSTIMVKTQDPSIGPSSAVVAKHVWPGFDWDMGRMFIDTETPLTSKPERYLNAFPATRQKFGEQEFWGCQKCGMKVSKTNWYCGHCGTRLS